MVGIAGTIKASPWELPYPGIGFCRDSNFQLHEGCNGCKARGRRAEQVVVAAAVAAENTLQHLISREVLPLMMERFPVRRPHRDGDLRRSVVGGNGIILSLSEKVEYNQKKERSRV